MKTKYLKIIFCFLLFTSLIQAFLAETSIPKSLFKNSHNSSKENLIYFVSHPKDSTYMYDTAYRKTHYRDFLNLDDSTYASLTLKNARFKESKWL